MRSVWALHPVFLMSLRRRKDTQRHRGTGEADTGGTQPQAKGQQGLPGATGRWEGQEGFTQSQRECGMPTPRFDSESSLV